MCEYANLQKAVFARLTTKTTWYILNQKHNVSVGKLRKAYSSWISNAEESQPQRLKYIHFTLRSPGRPLLIPQHPTVIIDSIKYFANN